MAVGDGENRMAAYLGLSQAYELAGDFRNAFAYQKKYIQLKDSLYGINKAKIINELSAKYEGEKKSDKDSEIDLKPYTYKESERAHHIACDVESRI